MIGQVSFVIAVDVFNLLCVAETKTIAVLYHSPILAGDPDLRSLEQFCDQEHKRQMSNIFSALFSYFANLNGLYILQTSKHASTLKVVCSFAVNLSILRTSMHALSTCTVVCNLAV